MNIFNDTLYPDATLKALVNRLEKFEIIYKATQAPVLDQSSAEPLFHWTLKQVFSYEH
jgi:hypothetical protein